jgi:hypothetical protein
VLLRAALEDVTWSAQVALPEFIQLAEPVGCGKPEL